MDDQTRALLAKRLTDEDRRRFCRERVAWSWMDYRTLRRGTLRLVPLESQMADWRRDYQAMTGEMFFGAAPTFDDIMRAVGDFERAFNGGAAA